MKPTIVLITVLVIYCIFPIHAYLSNNDEMLGESLGGLVFMLLLLGAITMMDKSINGDEFEEGDTRFTF